MSQKAAPTATELPKGSIRANIKIIIFLPKKLIVHLWETLADLTTETWQPWSTVERVYLTGLENSWRPVGGSSHLSFLRCLQDISETSYGVERSLRTGVAEFKHVQFHCNSPETPGDISRLKVFIQCAAATRCAVLSGQICCRRSLQSIDSLHSNNSDTRQVLFC